MLNKVVGYWAYIWGTYIRGGLIFGGGGLYLGGMYLEVYGMSNRFGK
jgi:hypothetical protein